LFSSTGSRPRPCSDGDGLGGGGGGALFVEPPGKAAGCSPGNTRAAARVAEPDVTMRTSSSMATTAAFLIVDSVELALLVFSSSPSYYGVLRWTLLL
jgi:hypothetical protein